MRANRDIRIFFALWPNPATRRELERIARQLPVERPARRVPDYNLHLTLHFIGNVDFDEMACLRQRARQARAAPFELVVDERGHFGKPRVAWLGCGSVPDALAQLHGDLGDRLRPCGYTPETRRFQPHVTVARKMAGAPPMAAFEPLRWKVDNFVLIESRPVDGGVRYQVVETYPLK